jgi:hypothetical protein
LRFTEILSAQAWVTYLYSSFEACMKLFSFLFLFLSNMLCAAQLQAGTISEEQINRSIENASAYFLMVGSKARSPEAIYRIYQFRKDFGLSLDFPEPMQFNKLDVPYKKFFYFSNRDNLLGKVVVQQADIQQMQTTDGVLRLQAFAYFCEQVPLPADYLDEIQTMGKMGGMFENFSFMALHKVAQKRCISEDARFKVIYQKQLEELTLLLQHPDLVGCTPTLNFNQTVFTMLITGHEALVTADMMNQIMHSQMQNGAWCNTEANTPDEMSSVYGMLSLFWYKKFVLPKSKP